MKQFIQQMNVYKEFKSFTTKIKNDINYWFTCLIQLFVEPTNNAAEQALRELVVRRKIICGLRREKGARIMETIMAMITTWKQQQKPLFIALKNCLWTPVSRYGIKKVLKKCKSVVTTLI